MAASAGRFDHQGAKLAVAAGLMQPVGTVRRSMRPVLVSCFTGSLSGYSSLLYQGTTLVVP